MEAESLKKDKVQLLALEKRYKVALTVDGIDFPVYLKGFVDRVDVCNGRVRIIDYKTGHVAQGDVQIADWDMLGENPDKSKAFQLLAYAYLHMAETGEGPVSAGIISLKNIGSGVLLFSMKDAGNSSNKVSIIGDQTLAGFKKVLDKLLLEICDPSIPLTEIPR